MGGLYRARLSYVKDHPSGAGFARRMLDTHGPIVESLRERGK
jgi:hypothetical protein